MDIEGELDSTPPPHTHTHTQLQSDVSVLKVISVCACGMVETIRWAGMSENKNLQLFSWNVYSYATNNHIYDKAIIVSST